MKTPAKSGDGSSASGLFRVAIIGAATLKGKELKDVLGDRSFPSQSIKLLDDEESLGQLEAVGDEPTFIQSVLPEHMEGIDFTFYVVDQAYTEKTWDMARRVGSEIIDLSYALEDHEGASLRAPWVEQELGQGRKAGLASAPVVVADPAAAVLALLLVRLQHTFPISGVNATVFEPASERGRQGMDELHDQTVNLLSFQQMPTAVFGTQIAFNLVPTLGEEAEPSMASVEERVLRHFRAITGGKAPVPSLMLLQAPVFHGHTFSIHLELESTASLGDVEAALSGEHVQIARTPQDEPSNVNVAGASQVQVAVRQDTQRKNAFWIWAASDNLRVSACMAVECAEDMAAMRPRGKVQ